jgi:hypothetical protein
MITEKNGNFLLNGYTAIPYRHHLSKNSWEVMVWKNGRQEKIRIIAPKAIDAAIRAIDQFPKYKNERDEVRRLNKLDKEDIIEEDENDV